MKRIIAIIFPLFCALFSTAQSGELIGNWGIADKSMGKSVIEFKQDQTAVLNIEGRELLIDEYIVGKNTDPIQVELITTIDGNPTSLFLLIQFIRGSTMKMEIFPLGSEQASQFSDDSPDTQVLLKKVR